MSVGRREKGHAIRPPAIEALELAKGEDIRLVPGDEQTLEIGKGPTRDAAIARLDRFAGSLSRDFRLDREKANER